jgi:hypothetical protein
MKKLVVMLTFLCITSTSFAKIIIRQECCNGACADKCWVIKICGKRNPCEEKGSLLINSAVISGNKLIVSIDTSKLSERDYNSLLKSQLKVDPTMLNLETIEENQIKGAKRPFSMVENSALITKGKNSDSKKRDWPPITITITIKIGK